MIRNLAPGMKPALLRRLLAAGRRSAVRRWDDPDLTLPAVVPAAAQAEIADWLRQIAPATDQAHGEIVDRLATGFADRWTADLEVAYRNRGAELAADHARGVAENDRLARQVDSLRREHALAVAAAAAAYRDLMGDLPEPPVPSTPCTVAVTQEVTAPTATSNRAPVKPRRRSLPGPAGPGNPAGPVAGGDD